MFTFARQMERKVQLALDAFSEFGVVVSRGLVLNPVNERTRFGHEGILRSLR
jgi:hypothetical protein